ncbi:nuclease [Candidatus Parcubacteria bacterium]|nr:MAG: nuclease [Candidatus Parcubacteria bacterium]
MTIRTIRRRKKRRFAPIGCAWLVVCCLLVMVASPPQPDNSPTSTPVVLATAGVTEAIASSSPAPSSTPVIDVTTNTPLPHTATLPPASATAATIPDCIPQSTQQQVGTVVNVVDGDTIDVIIEGQTYRVRYIGIDTPEKDEIFYKEATQANRELVLGKTVLLIKDVSETDRYGRLLRYVVADNQFVNYELVRRGYAMAATYPPDVACSYDFSGAQGQARLDRAGLWGLPTDTPFVPPPPPPQQAATQSSGCDPAYPTVCIPSPPPDLDCKDIPYRRFQVLPPDPHRFDRDKDGIGCEG